MQQKVRSAVLSVLRDPNSMFWTFSINGSDS